ncbi:SRPBCC family protein [Burkholderiaceae bacterium DAT-1]|nr:SRPBCC family protein [Burkholderiaceae bacterium DAT-1]
MIARLGRRVLSLVMAADIVQAAPLPDYHSIAVHEGSEWTLKLSFVVPYSVSEVWQVMTDYTHMPSFMPDVTESRIVSGNEQVFRLYQKTRLRAGVFSNEVVSTRDVVLEPMRSVKAHAVGGTAKHMDTVTTFMPEGRHTRVVYESSWIYDGIWASFVTDDRVKQQAQSQFELMYDEMIRRHGVLTAGVASERTAVARSAHD